VDDVEEFRGFGVLFGFGDGCVIISFGGVHEFGDGQFDGEIAEGQLEEFLETPEVLIEEFGGIGVGVFSG
jgi:hypothetical protein